MLKIGVLSIFPRLELSLIFNRCPGFSSSLLTRRNSISMRSRATRDPRPQARATRIIVFNSCFINRGHSCGPHVRDSGPIGLQDHLVATRQSVGSRRSVRHVTTYLLLLFLLLFSLMNPRASSSHFAALVPPSFPPVQRVTVSFPPGSFVTRCSSNLGQLFLVINVLQCFSGCCGSSLRPR